MGHDYKKPGLLRAGFEYQDLVAIKILIDFYQKRDRYAWVRLEAEGPEFKSIDDVVACRPDGLYELTQVKFTGDPESPDNKLSWAWLTTNDGPKKSWLQKWAKPTLSHKKAGTLAKAVLKTNRIPDTVFAKCLEGKKVNYKLVPNKYKVRIEEQLGLSANATSFFENFEFIHSQPVLDDLEEKLWQRISSDTDGGGWASFRQQVRQWSMLRNKPGPDGRIKYIHLRQAFAVERSRPIPQDFIVPPAYNVPDTNFDTDFLKEITDSDGLTVLWGPPGRGKSTYLSYCFGRINEQHKSICIRHHYFLSLGDRSQSRFHYHAIARSFEHQIKAIIPALSTSREDFKKLLEIAARQLQNDGQRLIVIVDGLDHVWRDHRDHEDMEELFNVLLPLPENIRLIVGTQKIADEHLPARLLKALPTKKWTELPLMSQAAVYQWLCAQNEVGRLNLKLIGRQTSEQAIRSTAGAFHAISHGLPLHLIYSFEAVVQMGKAITAEDVSELPACPTGDIRDYYQSLWGRIGSKSQAILNVLAGLEFSVPPFALHHCFGCGAEDFVALDEIRHLLDYQETEVRPFHGSLFAFVRDLSEHNPVFTAHVSNVLVWLETHAPDYWRWAWLWITKAQLGDPSDLLAGTNREWALDSLVAGYPVQQLINILCHAEKAAFTAFDLPLLLNFHLLKTRVIDGLEFQGDEWVLFSEISASLSNDQHLKNHLRADIYNTPSDALLSMIRNVDESAQADLAQTVINELNRRAQRCQGERMEVINQHYHLAKYTVMAASYVGLSSVPRMVTFSKKFTDTDSLIAAYANESINASGFDNLFEVGKLWSEDRLDRDVLAALCFEGLMPSTKLGLKALTHPAVCCLSILGGSADIKPQVEKDISHLFPADNHVDSDLFGKTREVAYDVFFATLAEELSGSEVDEWSKIPTDFQQTWTSIAIRALERLARSIAIKWKQSQQWPTLRDIYGSLELEQPISSSHRERRNFIVIRLALLDIAIDLCTIAIGLDSQSIIDENDIESVLTSPFWLDELWLDAFDERRLPLHTAGAVEVIVKRMGHQFDTKVTEFRERSTTILKLARFAADHELDTLARKKLKETAGCLLGYMGHKDLFALEVLESLKILEKRGITKIREIILDLAGEFEAITDYTDGDGTYYIREKYYETIAKYFPERIPACYGHLIRNEEWSYAEIFTTAIAKTECTKSNARHALFESYIVPSEISTLEAISEFDPDVEKVVASVRQKTGKSCEKKFGQDENETIEVETAEVSDLDPSTFPTGRLKKYLHAIHSTNPYDYKREFVGEWLKYWEASGRAIEAIDDFKSVISEGDYRPDCDAALDTVFEVALKAQGRSKAFPWIVRSHIAGYGWLRQLSSDEKTQTRIQLVAKHYPNRWREFIQQTAEPRFVRSTNQNEVVIGLSRLVYFLVEVGELKMASNYAIEMVHAFKNELSEQPIEVPEWAR